MAATLRTYLELVRFSHTVFALPFALLSAALAWNQPGSPFDGWQLLGIVLCMVCARSAAMAFNRVVDRRFDGDNPRTAKRHIPAGLLGLTTVIAFTVICSAGFIAATLLFLPNRWPVILSVPVLLFLLGYSYAKRFTVWCHYWLSAALMLSPICTWIAIRGEVAITPAHTCWEFCSAWCSLDRQQWRSTGSLIDESMLAIRERPCGICQRES